MNTALENTINAAWEARAELSPETTGEHREAVETAILALDSGKMRVAEKTGNNDWVVHQWLKNCLLYTSPSPRDLSTSRMPSSA